MSMYLDTITVDRGIVTALTFQLLSSGDVTTALGFTPGVGTVTSVTGTAGRIASTGGSTPVLDLATAGTAGTYGTVTTDSFGRVTSGIPGGIITDSYAATITFSMTAGSRHEVTLGGNPTLAVSNVTTGQVFTIRLIQDGAGSRTVSWFGGINWPGGTAPTLTTTQNKADAFIFECRAANVYDGFILGQNL